MSTLPAKFNALEHAKKLIRIIHNKKVKAFFKDIDNDVITDKQKSVRHQERLACFMQPKDGVQTISLKIMLFEFIMGNQKMSEGYYSEPVYDVQANRKFKPQIELVFHEKWNTIKSGKSPLKARIKGIRLMNESSTTLTNTELKNLAIKIKDLFGKPTQLIWHKGKILYSYNEPEKGYKLQIYAKDITEVKKIIDKVLAIQLHEPNWAFLSKSDSEEPLETYPEIPGKTTILGKSYDKHRKRPNATLEFQYACIHIHGLTKPIILYDASYRFANALLR
jgi:hypothetical protein